MPFSAFIGPALGLFGGLMAGDSARDAANTQAQASRDAANIAAQEARFRPVGITTRFGQSNFQTGPDGRVSGAGYTLDPALKAYQDRFMGLAGQGLTQAEGAQQQFAPLGQAAQGLFGLGQGYLAQSPQQAAQQYMAQQQELLAPSRERQLSQVQNSLFNSGRQGLAVGATGARPSGAAGLGAASPEMEAYYNALAQQDAQLATQATQGGMDQARFGAGLFGTGGNLLTQQYGGQAAALGPYEAYLQQMKGLEALGQQSLSLGMDIGASNRNPTGANALFTGNMPSRESYQANAFNPFANLLMSASQNPALRNITGSGIQSAFSQTGLGGSGFGTGLAYGNQDLGAYY